MHHDWPGIAFSVFIVSAALSRFSASVVSKDNARKMLQKQLKKQGQERQMRGRKKNVLHFVKTCYNAAKREVRGFSATLLGRNVGLC